jgi:hypothetical protein
MEGPSTTPSGEQKQHETTQHQDDFQYQAGEINFAEFKRRYLVRNKGEIDDIRKYVEALTRGKKAEKKLKDAVFGRPVLDEAELII